MARGFWIILLLLTVYLAPAPVFSESVNQGSVHSVELMGSTVVVAEAAFLLRFDMPPSAQNASPSQPPQELPNVFKEGNKYTILTKEAEGRLLKDWEVQSPPSVQVVARKATVELIDHSENTNYHTIGKTRHWTRVDSKVYKLRVQLSLAKASGSAKNDPSLREGSEIGDVVVRFPSALEIRRGLGATSPATVPEVRFHITWWSSNEAKAQAKARDNLGSHLAGLAISCAALVIAVLFMYKRQKLGGYSLLVAVVSFAASLHFLYLSVEALSWIIPRWQLLFIASLLAGGGVSVVIYVVRRRLRRTAPLAPGAVAGDSRRLRAEATTHPDPFIKTSDSPEHPVSAVQPSARISTQDGDLLRQWSKNHFTEDTQVATDDINNAFQAPKNQPVLGLNQDGHPTRLPSNSGQGSRRPTTELRCTGQSPAGKKTVKGKEVLADIQAGMGDVGLMQKYGLSAKQLVALYKKLEEAGLLKKGLNVERPKVEV